MESSLFKYKNVEWSLPLLFQYEPIWTAIHDRLKDYCIPIPKVNLFGSPSNVWAGGRVPAIYGDLKKNLLVNLFEYLRKHNATPSFTFTATDITKEDLKDKYANYILDIALENNSKFIVHSDLLKNHIKEKKADATVIASVIKSNFRFQGPDRIENPTIENESNYYNELLKEYDIVVVRPEYSKTTLVEHPEYIDDISRIEVLINQPCIYNCPKMPEHYKCIEKFKTNPNAENYFKCIRFNIPANIQYENTLAHSQKTVEMLVKNGIKRLKLQGRGSNIPVISLLQLISSQMMNFDGNGYQIFEKIHIALEIKSQEFLEQINNI